MTLTGELVDRAARLTDEQLDAPIEMPIGTIELSAPPATITSASPSMMSRAASPMAWTPVAQAVTTEWFGPLKPYLMETCPEARLISADGMKNGDIRRALPLATSSDAS